MRPAITITKGGPVCLGEYRVGTCEDRCIELDLSFESLVVQRVPWPEVMTIYHFLSTVLDEFKWLGFSVRKIQQEPNISVNASDYTAVWKAVNHEPYPE